METNDEKITIVIYTGHYWQTVLVKHYLEDQGIEAFLKNEKNGLNKTIFNPFGSWDTVSVAVSNLDYEKAKVIVSEYEKKAQKQIPET